MKLNFEIKFIYDSLEKDYTKEALSYFAKEFHTDFSKNKYNDSKYSCYIPNLFLDFFNPQEFTVISKRFLEETTSPNLQFSSILFRLSRELNSNKTKYEKELMYSLVFNMLSKHEKNFNDATSYSIGFVASQAMNIGVDISPSLVVMNKLNANMKYIGYFEEGFTDALTGEYSNILANEKLFKLFSAKYENWGNTSQTMFKKMYVDFIEEVPQAKIFNPINAQSLFWMNNYFTNESLKNYVKDYCNKAFKEKVENQQVNNELEQSHFQVQQNLKSKENDIHKFEKFVEIIKDNFEGLKEVSPLEESANQILIQILKNQKTYIKELETYKVENEKTKKLKEGFRKVL